MKKWDKEGWLPQALEQAVRIVEGNIPVFYDHCQDPASTGRIYRQRPNDEWTTGFWVGQLWLAYEYTGRETFRDCALHQCRSFERRIQEKIQVDHHDMGFLYTPSCVAAFKLTGDAQARSAALAAADQLLSRFQEKGRFIQAWGELGAAENYRYIIDCMLNLPLLYWASETTNDPAYRRVALAHTETCLRNSFREDGTVHHTFFLDPESGKPLYGRTWQGYRDDTVWARGMGWALYGTALAYRYNRDERFPALFAKTLSAYCARLPEDQIPYWDLCFQSGNEPRDSSTAAIAACALLEMAELLVQKSAEYTRLAASMLETLYERYSVKKPVAGTGLLLHGTYSKKSPYNGCTENGVDECTSWGDYFYLEALVRLAQPWQPYW